MLAIHFCLDQLEFVFVSQSRVCTDFFFFTSSLLPLALCLVSYFCEDD